MAYGKLEEIGRIQKGDKGDYIVVRKCYNNENNVESIDIRLSSTSDSGDILPNKKGVRIPNDMMGNLIEILFNGAKDIMVDALSSTVMNSDKVGDIIKSINEGI